MTSEQSADTSYDEEPLKILTVKEFSEEEKPREKAAKYGIESLTNSELLAIILRSGRPGLPVTEISRRLMENNDNKFLKLERMSDEELLDVPGIGPVKVLEVRVMLEIMRRYSAEKLGDRVQFKQPEHIYDYMRFKIANLTHEEMWVIFVDNSNRLSGTMKISEGSATGTIFDSKKIFHKAFISRAHGIILCHNHPSGTLFPSPQDLQITRNFNAQCKILEFRFIDHLIVTTDGFYSFHENGKLE